MPESREEVYRSKFRSCHRLTAEAAPRSDIVRAARPHAAAASARVRARATAHGHVRVSRARRHERDGARCVEGRPAKVAARARRRSISGKSCSSSVSIDARPRRLASRHERRRAESSTERSSSTRFDRPPGQLGEALRAQVLRKLAHVARMPADDGIRVLRGLGRPRGRSAREPAPVDPLAAVWTAVREQPPFEHVKAALERVTRRTASPQRRLAQLDRFGFSAEERRWIDLASREAARARRVLRAAPRSTSASRGSSCIASRSRSRSTSSEKTSRRAGSTPEPSMQPPSAPGSSRAEPARTPSVA